MRVEHDFTASGRRRTAPSTAKPAAARRRPLSRAWARLLSALHGDKYLVPTDPPTWEPAPAAARRSATKAGSDESAAERGARDASSSPSLVVILGLLVVGLVTSVRILKQYERGVQFRLGRARDGAKGPGLIFIIPLIDRVRRVSLRMVTMPIESHGIITRDNVRST